MSNFEIDPTNYLGQLHNKYRTAMYNLALSKPTQYTEKRELILDSVKIDATKDLYKTLFNLLSKGTNARGQPICTVKTAAGSDMGPSYPEQKINNICLGASATLDAIIEEIIEIILPADWNVIMSNRLMIKAAGQEIK